MTVEFSNIPEIEPKHDLGVKWGLLLWIEYETLRISGQTTQTKEEWIMDQLSKQEITIEE